MRTPREQAQIFLSRAREFEKRAEHETDEESKATLVTLAQYYRQLMLTLRDARESMPSDGTIGYLVGRLIVLRIECPICGRRGRYRVDRLVAELGPGYRLTDWLHAQTADCPNKAPGGPTRACGAIMPDLVGLS